MPELETASQLPPVCVVGRRAGTGPPWVWKVAASFAPALGGRKKSSFAGTFPPTKTVTRTVCGASNAFASLTVITPLRAPGATDVALRFTLIGRQLFEPSKLHAR